MYIYIYVRVYIIYRVYIYNPLVNTGGYPSDPDYIVINGRPQPPPFGAPLKNQKTSP